MEKVSVFSYFKKYKFSIFFLTIVSLLQVTFIFFVPIIIKEIIEIGQTKKVIDQRLLIYFLIAVLSLYLITILHSRFKLSFLVRFNTIESKYFFNKLLSMDMSVIDAKGPTYFTNRIRSSISNLYELVGSFANGVIVAVLTILTTLYFIYNLNFELFILFLILIPISFLSYKRMNYNLQQKSANLQRVASVCEQNIINIVQNIYMIKQLFNYQKFVKVLTSNVNKQYSESRKVGNYALLLSQSIDLILNIIKNTILFIAIYYFIIGELTIANFIFINLLISIFFSALTDLNKLNISKRDLNVSIDFFNNEILAHIENDFGKQELKEIKEIDISVDKFSFDGAKNILKNINLTIEKKSDIGIVGLAGSGKSTLLKLLNRTYFTKNIKINDINYENYTLKSLREKIYYSSQNVLMFPGTIEENILIGLDNFDRIKLKEIYQSDFLADFIENQPQKENTIIGENGLNLSGGQKQKIILARILIRDPEIIIMDESTSNLDSHSEERFNFLIKKYFSDRIIIRVSHRISTIKRCKKLILINNGEIDEENSYHDLKNNNTIFQKIFKEQIGKVNNE